MLHYVTHLMILLSPHLKLFTYVWIIYCLIFMYKTKFNCFLSGAFLDCSGMSSLTCPLLKVS